VNDLRLLVLFRPSLGLYFASGLNLELDASE